MDAAAETWLIVLSVTLSAFLIALTVALIYFISLLRQLKRITDRAENVADSVESAAAAFERTASPLAILRLISNIAENVNKFKRKKKG